MGNIFSVLKIFGDEDGVISLEVGNKQEILKIDCRKVHLSLKSEHIQGNEDLEGILDAHINPKNVKCCRLEGTPVSLLPTQIGAFINLKVLSLRENQLVDLPWSIIYLKQLEKLDLTSNLLNSIPSSIGNLKSLKELFLRNNRLTFLPTEILLLTELKVLDVTENPIKSPPEKIAQTGLPNILLYLRHRSRRSNLFEGFKPWISDSEGPPTTSVPSLIQICVECAMKYDIDFLNSPCLPPKVKAILLYIKNEQKNTVFICKCSCCLQYFSKKTLFKVHACKKPKKTHISQFVPSSWD